LADFIAPSRDFLQIPEDDINDLVSHLTVVGGNIVHGDGDFHPLAPPMPCAPPDWSPVRYFGDYQPMKMQRVNGQCCNSSCTVHQHDHGKSWLTSTPVNDERTF